MLPHEKSTYGGAHTNSRSLDCRNGCSKDVLGSEPSGRFILEMTRMGGGFGRRLYMATLCLGVAVEISDAIKKPVKMVSTAEKTI